MSENNGTCILCGSVLKHKLPSINDFGDFFNCFQCGKYTLADSLETWREFKNNAHLLAGYFFETRNRSLKANFPVITKDFYHKILNNPIVPKKISEKPIKLLKYLNSATKSYGTPIKYPPAALYAKDMAEVNKFEEELERDGYIQGEDNLESMITLKGMRYVEDYEQHAVKRDQAFVAMWFNESEQIVTDMWNKIIQPACEEAGYRAVRVLEREYNDGVVDEIIALIK